MTPTRFLGQHEYDRYRLWLLDQDPATLRNFFGITVSEDTIDALVDKILVERDQHYFLVGYVGEVWAGVLHIARVSSTELEFGIIVSEQYRGRGIADTLIQEGITWARNRGYERLYLHCLGSNAVMRHLAEKHGLDVKEVYGDADAVTRLPPPSFFSYAQEACNLQKNIFYINLKRAWLPFSEIHG